MDVGQWMAAVAAAYLCLPAAFAALTTARYLSNDLGDELGNAIFRSVTKTTVFIGLPTVIGFLVFLNADASGSGSGGMMSRNMGLFILFMIGAFGLAAVWVGTLVMGFIGAAVARRMQPLVGAAVVFAFCTGGVPLFAALYVVTAQAEAMKRHHP